MGNATQLYNEAFRAVVYCAYRDIAVAVFVMLIGSGLAWGLCNAKKDLDGYDAAPLIFITWVIGFISTLSAVIFVISAVDGLMNTPYLAHTTVYEMQRPSVPVKSQ